MLSVEIVKKHPYVTGAVLLVGGLIFYLIVSSGGSSPAASSSNSGTGSASGEDLAIANVNAASTAASAQYGSQVEMSQIAGQVADAQTAAQLSAVQLETASAEAIVSTQTKGATDVAQINADSTTQQTLINANAATDIADTSSNDSLLATEATVTAQASVANHKLDVFNNVITNAGTDKGRSSTGYAQIISAFEGEGPEAIAANQPSNVANSASAILKSSTGIVSSVLSNLF